MIGWNGLKLIKSFEGFSPLEYTCVAGKRTIGYGHVLRAGECYPAGVTEAEAETLLLDDVAEAEQTVIDLVEVPLSANQFDALVSFVFNVGWRKFAGSTLLKKLNAADYDGAAAEFLRWKYAGGTVINGLLRRRIAEKKLFET